MKKKILLVAFLATITMSQAQEDEKTNTDKVTFGVKGGINISSADFDDSVKDIVPSVSSLVGANVGVFTNIPLGGKFAFQPEVLFSMQGFKYIYDDVYSKSDIETKLNYISIPLNTQFYIIDKLYIAAGSQFDLLVSAKGSYTSTVKFTNEVTTVTDKDLKYNYKSLVFGINFGAGYKINDNISANVRYCLGLSPANKGNTITSRNRVLQIGVGYSF